MIEVPVAMNEPPQEPEYQSITTPPGGALTESVTLPPAQTDEGEACGLVGVEGGAVNVMVKLVLLISKKMLALALTLMRAVVVAILGMTTLAEPLLGTALASVVG